MSRLLKLRRDDVCVTCDAALAAGTTAYWFPSERRTRCVPCGEVGVAPERLPVRTDDAARRNGVPGGSASAEYEKRAERERRRHEQAVADDAAWRARWKADHRFLGPVVTAFTPKSVASESQSTAAWRAGAEGEARVGQVLAGVAGVEVLHDRRWPGTRGANIDHVVVAPSGIFVVDAKNYGGSRIEVIDKGSWLQPDWRLNVNGRNRTKLVDGVLAQAAAVRGVLTGLADVPVSGVLCFIGADWGLLGMRTAKTLHGATILWPLKLPELVGASGSVDVARTAAHMRRALKPVT